MRSPSSKLWILVPVLILLVCLVPRVEASVIGVGVGEFGPGSTLTTFTGLPNGLQVNGLIADGITFSYSLGSGIVVIGGGPGVSNNISPPTIVSTIGGDRTGIMTLLFPSFVSNFGYGYALLNPAAPAIPNATTITLFNGATNVGSLSYTSALDPTFPGGFAGIQSTIPFDRAQVVFSTAGLSFAMDNIRTSSAVPESSTVVLLVTGLGLLWSCRHMIRARTR